MTWRVKANPRAERFFITIKSGAFLLVAALLASFPCSTNAIRRSMDIPPPFLANKQCRIIISEMNIYPGGGSQFIELMRVCYPEPKNVFNVAMDKKYKLIFIDHSGFLVGVCDLKNEASRRTGKFVFYVIGGPRVKNVDMSLGDCDFPVDIDNYDSNLLPDSHKAPIAVALIYHPKGSLEWLTLNSERGLKYKVPLTNDIEKKIIPLIVDMYVYTTSSPYTSCDYFETFYDGYKRDHQLILRDWATSDLDRTVSRCSPEDEIMEEKLWDPLQPTYFKYAKSTPGDVNDCKTAVTFRIEETEPIRDPPVVKYRTTPEYSCYITTRDPYIDTASVITSASKYLEALKTLIEQADASHHVPEVNELPLSAVTTAANPKPVPMDQSLFEAELAKSIPHTWDDCEKFGHKDFISELRNDKHQYLKPDHVLRKDVCNWFDYIVPHSFRCKLCNSLWNQEIVFDRPGSSLLKAVKTPRPLHTGKSDPIKYLNKKLIHQHINNPIHQLAIDYFALFDEGKRGEVLYDEFYRDGGPMRLYLRPTEYAFVGVFQSTRMDIPFYKHPIMTQTLIYYDVNVGHLYHTPSGAKTITMSISESMHEDFVQDFFKRKPELSVMIDTSTDIATIASIAVLFQTYDESKRVVVRLYKLLPAGRRETGENLFSLFKRELAKDGLVDYVKDKCVGFASDGVSNVKKFRRLLKEWTGRELLAVHCYAHKLDLALKHSWEQMHYLHDVDETANDLYRMFNSRSHTKKALLYETTAELGYTRFELKRIVPTRWINTKRRAFSTVLANWPVLVKAIEAVIADRSTRKPQRELAKSIESSLKDPTLIATMAFVADACEDLAAVSIELQGRSSSLIGRKELRNKLVARLTQLKTTNGPKLQSLLDKSAVVEAGNRHVPSLPEFESNDVELDGVLLNPYVLDENSLQTQRCHYIDTVIEEINSYFPTDATDDLDIFDPRQWPSVNLQNFGNTQIIRLNEELRWNVLPTVILQDWMDLKAMISVSADFIRLRTKQPEEFWAAYLNPGSSIVWPESLRTILTNILVIPASTAEVERIYSLYTNIKTVQRYNLDVSTVDSLIRIKFNGPKDPRDFDAARYARNFILRGHSRADDGSRKGKKRSREDDVSQIDEMLTNDNIDPVNPEEDDMGSSFDDTIFNGDEMDVANYVDDVDDDEFEVDLN